MRWHPDDDTVFFVLEDDGIFNGHGTTVSIWSVTLSTRAVCILDADTLLSATQLQGGWDLCGADWLSVLQRGSKLGCFLSCCQSDNTVSHYVIIDWLSGTVCWKVSDVSVNTFWPVYSDLIWTSQGEKFAFVQKPEDLNDSSDLWGIKLCVVQPRANMSCNGTREAHYVGAEVTSAQLLEVLPSMKWDPPEPALSIAKCFSPSGRFLAMTFYYDRDSAKSLQLIDVINDPLFRRNAVILLDTSQPNMPVACELEFHDGFSVHSMTWSPDSTVLCAVGSLYTCTSSCGHVNFAGQFAYLFRFASQI